MKEQMKEMVRVLNEARKAYEQDDIELMTNAEYDALYDQLEKLEKETGIIFPNSPTQNVGYEVLSSLPKEVHPKRMLSLDKTKDVAVLQEFMGDQKGILSWKIDGLTVVLTYEDGRLFKAVTRGNGEIGEVVTANAKVFQNLPVGIPYKGRLVLRGEAHITYSQFEKINAQIEAVDAKYKNPRNLCSGSVRQLDSSITAKRGVDFIAFSLVEAEGVDFKNSRHEQLNWLESQGFETVERIMVNRDTLEDAIAYFAEKIKDMDIPSDGLVFMMDDIAYGSSLGETSKFPRDAMAFKWKDETAVTKLLEIEWSPSRTGLINPVAIFEPVELEGTTVARASVHNISILRQLALGIGDEIEVYKANMIIPQILNNRTRSGNLTIPETCPVCGKSLTIKADTDAEVLMCTNEECQVKHIKSFTHFVSRDAMNIDGMSEATIEKFVDAGLIKSYGDFFRLERYEEEISSMEGFGLKSFQNILSACLKAAETSCARLLYALGVPNIGTANAKMIAKACGHDWSRITGLTVDELLSIDGIGEIMAKDFRAFFDKPSNQEKIEDLLSVITFEQVKEEEGAADLAGKTFVITGSLETFGNRKELQEQIEARGGKVAGSVSSKTDYLINNDITSNSGKNRKAKELGIPIITERDYLEM